MITPTEIKKKALRHYSTYLQSIVDDVRFSPIVIAGNKKPSDDIEKFEAEITELINNSKEKTGCGYVIEYQTVKTRKHGLQDLPVSISFQTESDYLRYINKEKDTHKFRADCSRILLQFPELKDWIVKYPNKVIENDWKGLLKVCQYFKQTPQPHLYIRELPIQVHTKFVEHNKGILQELLDIIIVEYVNVDQTRFEKRYGLKYDEPIVRFRVLDKSISNLHFSGIEDITVPVSQFSQINLPIQIVYIVENKMNLLSFPPRDKSIVVWGHGFGVDIMKDVEWLRNKKIYYWGDLDAHGFQILSEIRTHFSQVESFLMDRDTFDKYYEGDFGSKSIVEKELCLTREENEVFKFLKENQFRLEQEKIPFDYAAKMIPME